MSHTEQRIIDRLILEAGISEGDAQDMFHKANMIALNSRYESIGMLLCDVNFQGIEWSDSSNGNQVWAIIRNNRVVTVMFRRSTQPDTCEALRVNKIIK